MNIKTTIGATKLFFIRNGADIAVYSGAAGDIAAMFLIYKKSPEIHQIVEEGKKEREGMSKKDRFFSALKTGFKVIKTAAVPIAIATTSTIGIVSGHCHVRAQLGEVSATAGALTAALEEYRSRVAAEVGKDKESDIFNGTRTVEVDDGPNEKKEVNLSNPVISPYQVVFEEGMAGWEPDRKLTLMWLDSQQNYASDMLVAYGHLFMNDLLSQLQWKKTKNGNVVGWIHRADGNGDGFVDFGISDKMKDDFLNGRIDKLVLNFNCDGPILDSCIKYGIMEDR